MLCVYLASFPAGTVATGNVQKYANGIVCFIVFFILKSVLFARFVFKIDFILNNLMKKKNRKENYQIILFKQCLRS